MHLHSFDQSRSFETISKSRERTEPGRTAAMIGFGLNLAGTGP
jgi:hypothetical protein